MLDYRIAVVFPAERVAGIRPLPARVCLAVILVSSMVSYALCYEAIAGIGELIRAL